MGVWTLIAVAVLPLYNMARFRTTCRGSARQASHALHCRCPGIVQRHLGSPRKVPTSQTLAPLTQEVQVLLGLARPATVRVPRVVPILYGTRAASPAGSALADAAVSSNEAMDFSWP